MPNWCIGSLRIRGKKDDIFNFIKQQLVVQSYEKSEEFPFPEIIESPLPYSCFSEDGIELPSPRVRICGLHRVFVDSKYVSIQPFEEDENIFVIAIDCKVAWAFETDKLQELSQKFKLDFRLYSFEMGMEFNQDIEIIDGEIIKDNCIEFKDGNYVWECIMPNLGG